MALGETLQEILLAAARRISSFDRPAIVTHVDADGIAAGSIILSALRRLGKSADIHPIRQLDAETARLLPADRQIIFTDLGSGQLALLAGRTAESVIIDHHEAAGEALRGCTHVNAGLLGLSGAREISGAGLAYLVASRISPCPDLAPLAITGACGDVQAERGLSGLNRRILEDGISAGAVKARKGLPYFGRETRDLCAFLSYSSDPYLPGLTGDIHACSEFLASLGIPADSKYNRLSPAETSKLVTAVYERAIQSGLSSWEISRLATEYYIFPDEREGTEMRDAMEFSTLLNSCGRNGEAATGIEICLGDRGSAYRRAQALLVQHRENLRKGIELLSERKIAPVGRHLQAVYLEGVKPTIVGIVAGMALGGRMIPTDRAVAAAADQDEGTLKISARGTQEMVRAGLNLAAAVRSAAAAVGGLGGGHNIAAGATIPKGSFEQFCELLDSEISKQFAPPGIRAVQPRPDHLRMTAPDRG